MMHRLPVLVFFLVTLLGQACSKPDTGTTDSASQAPASAAGMDQEFVERTADAHAGDVPVASTAASTPPAARAIGEQIAYGEIGAQNLRGYLAMPADVTGPLPGIIVIHEWWGLNDNIRKMTRRLAGEGYMALAVDLYRGQVADNPEDARKLMVQMLKAPEKADENLRQAYTYLKKTVGVPRIGVIGWCLGGGWALRTVLLFPQQLDAAVIYYGSVGVSEKELKPVQVPILGFFGSEDRAISVNSVETFRSTLKRLGKQADIRIYQGAGHAFANPSGTHYQAFAAQDAWHRTLAFLGEKLASGR